MEIPLYIQQGARDIYKELISQYTKVSDLAFKFDEVGLAIDIKKYADQIKEPHNTEASLIKQALEDNWEEIDEILYKAQGSDPVLLKDFFKDAKHQQEALMFAVKDFNKTKILQYMNSEAKKAGVTSISASPGGASSTMFVTVTTKDALTQEQNEAVKSYISGQCSDGWGEGLVQRVQTINNQKVYVVPWHENYTFKLKKRG